MNNFKQYIKEYFLKQEDEMTNKSKVYLQQNRKCVCHHLNRPERVHNIFELVLSQNPVRCKPENQ